MNIIGTKGRLYSTVRQIASAENYNLHECNGDGKVYFLKIAKSKKENKLLEKEEFILETLLTEALRIEKEYKDNKGKDAKSLNYQYLFPEVVDSFISKEYESRKVLILSFENISEKVSDLTPISFITERDGVCVDPKTSVWILGKLLKMLVFTQDICVSIGDISADNILINKNKHCVAIEDWSNSFISNTFLDEKVRSEEIVKVTKEVITLLGGNPTTGEIPLDESMPDTQYQDILKRLVQGEFSDALDAHKAFYKTARALWPSKFHHYTTKLKSILKF